MKRVKVRGAQRHEMDADQFALALFLSAKAEVDYKRMRAEADRRRRTEELGARDER